MSFTVKTIQPSGIFDGTKVTEFRQEISTAIESGVDIILVDCQDLTFMDSSGLGLLVIALKSLRAEDRKLCLCSINEQIDMLFSLTDTHQIFQIYTDRVDFEQAVLVES